MSGTLMLDDTRPGPDCEHVAPTLGLIRHRAPGGIGANACARCRWRDKCLPSVAPQLSCQNAGVYIGAPSNLCKKRVLYREGAPFSSIYIVRAGALKALTTSDDGSEHVVALHLAGDFLGGEGVATGRRSRTVVAFEDSEVCSISFAALENLMVDFPPVQRWFHRAMSGELARCAEALSLLRGGGGAEQRIAGFLLDLSRRGADGDSGGREINLDLNRGDIAIYLGLRRETVSRVFAKFQRERWVEGAQGRVELQDRDALQKVASGA